MAERVIGKDPELPKPAQASVDSAIYFDYLNTIRAAAALPPIRFFRNSREEFRVANYKLDGICDEYIFEFNGKKTPHPIKKLKKPLQAVYGIPVSPAYLIKI